MRFVQNKNDHHYFKLKESFLFTDDFDFKMPNYAYFDVKSWVLPKTTPTTSLTQLHDSTACFRSS